MTNSYYEGSKMFLWLANLTGINVDQVNFLISQFVALALASLFRTVLHPSKTNSATRHGFGLIVGLIIGYFCFGTQAIHLAGLPALCYIVIRTQSPEIMQRMVLAVALLYLSAIHLHRQMYDYGSYSLDVTGPLMVITQKVTSLAFNIHDGLTRKEVDLSKNQKYYAVRRMPTALEYFSYALNFPALMAGPAIFYRDYMDFIDGKSFMTVTSNGTIDKKNQDKTVVIEPSPIKVCFQKAILSLICAFIYIKFTPMFPIASLKDDDFENKSLTYKFVYLHMVTMLVRFKYYFAWLLSDAICNNAGLGFNGYDEHGAFKWNRFSNINILKFEFGSNLRESIEAWNMGTNKWLRMVVYERVQNYPIVLTYALSALWHGFYPGYYLTFANGAIFTIAARTMRRTVRDYFTGNAELKLIYDIATCILTRLVMAYITFTFVLLDFWPSVRLYLHMHLCLHIVAVIAILIVPRVIRRAVPGDSSQLSAKGRIAHALRKASPLTNSVSNHHD
ncbi:lysophospholipid acyltransferase 2 isoform X2 [Agrilus planipennis]|uniref:Lysophospholipid acyltransferase 2 isoform X2 n=1 Tax=Agrilus planipennis TaxID=224129 RepID=A0A7F5RJI2_AGRPL|nr:lysophospholipid acyltransferase 2 isoform X2 [Agrilus planipennis]